MVRQSRGVATESLERNSRAHMQNIILRRIPIVSRAAMTVGYVG